MSVNNVLSTQTASAQLSRHDLLSWVNSTLQSKFTKIDELCTGAAYCQMMDLLFPKIVPLKRVKFHTNLEHEFIDNYKILQAVFQKLEVNKAIPIDRLVRGKFKDNIEFLQWFKRFFDANYKHTVYDAIVARNGQPMGYGGSTSKIEAMKLNDASLAANVSTNASAGTSHAQEFPTKDADSSIPHRLERSLTRTELRIDTDDDFFSSLGGTANKLQRILDYCDEVTTKGQKFELEMIIRIILDAKKNYTSEDIDAFLNNT